MTGRPFIDGHLHAWDQNRIRYPWLTGDPAMPTTFEPIDLPSEPDLAAAVFVEAAAEPAEAFAEAAWAASLGAPVAAIVAFATVELGEGVQDHLEQLLAIPEVVGVRRLLQDEPRGLLEDERLATGLRKVGRQGLTFDLCVRSEQLPLLAKLVRDAPETVFVLDHLGKPPIRAGWDDDRAVGWRRALRDLAAEENVVLKISGAAAEAGPGPLEPQAQPFIAAAIDLFGTDRTMVGSDWPVSRRVTDGPSYAGWFDFVLNGFGLTPDEQTCIATGTAARTYRIEK